jgi:hypothetical protein
MEPGEARNPWNSLVLNDWNVLNVWNDLNQQ